MHSLVSGRPASSVGTLPSQRTMTADPAWVPLASAMSPTTCIGSVSRSDTPGGGSSTVGLPVGSHRTRRRASWLGNGPSSWTVPSTSPAASIDIGTGRTTGYGLTMTGRVSVRDVSAFRSHTPAVVHRPGSRAIWVPTPGAYQATRPLGCRAEARSVRSAGTSRAQRVVGVRGTAAPADSVGTTNVTARVARATTAIANLRGPLLPMCRSHSPRAAPCGAPTTRNLLLAASAVSDEATEHPPALSAGAPPPAPRVSRQRHRRPRRPRRRPARPATGAGPGTARRRAASGRR